MTSLGTRKASDLLKLKDSMRELKTTGPAGTPSTSITKTNQTGFIARLHAFLPPTFTSSNNYQSSPVITESTPPIYLKTRIVTWNMHDSLPRGNLENLLGMVSEYVPRKFDCDLDRLELPNLSMEEGHPYHIIVIAGQECPTLSGIPMGLAANFKYRDHRDKEKHKDIELEEVEKRRHKGRDLIHRAEDLIQKHMKHEHNGHINTDSDSSSDEDSPHDPTISGWSAVLEDWFANGVGSMHGLKPVVTAIPEELNTASSSLPTAARPNGAPRNRKPSTIDVNWLTGSATVQKVFSTTSASGKKGPYELLIKERLMGIYMAIYVHRDIRPLIQGVSSDTVPAGLIGGRLGNKGGIGISLKVHGTTLLFLNAHLAAHEGKAQLRVANLNKIKNELNIDSFLSANDPRMVSEDLTDKYDYTFILGDLNFRLDISRLHADWLISRKEYAKALGFDQLKDLIKNGDAFKGFCEGDINFPPTFKYDVLRHKSKSDKTELKPGFEEERDEVVEQEEGRGDNISTCSSFKSESAHSKRDTEGSFSFSDRPIGLTVLKVKAALVALVHPSRKRRLSAHSLRHQRHTSGLSASGSKKHRFVRASSLNNRVNSTFLSTSMSPSRTASQKESLTQSGETAISNYERGVYDSSTKQRVPSWCDRILWKTTIKASDDVDDLQPIQVNPPPPRRFSQVLPTISRRTRNEPFIPRRPSSPFKSQSAELPTPTHRSNHEEVTLEATGRLQRGAEGRRQNSLPGSSQPSRQWFSLLPRRADTGDSNQSVRTTKKSESLAVHSGPTRWRWPFSMMSRETSVSNPPGNIRPRYRKGDVICISYRTLDDRQMRDLEGHSDHRPVIGDHAICI